MAYQLQGTVSERTYQVTRGLTGKLSDSKDRIKWRSMTSRGLIMTYSAMIDTMIEKCSLISLYFQVKFMRESIPAYEVYGSKIETTFI